MLILGLQRGHDAGATLIHDGALKVIAEAERVNGIKHADGNQAAADAIAAALKEIGAAPGDVDKIIIADSYWEQFENHHPAMRARHHGAENLFSLGSVGDLLQPMGAIGVDGLASGTEVYGLCHHLAHAVSTHFMSGFGETNALVVDGYGVCCGTSAYSVKNKTYARLEHWIDRFLLGWRYMLFAEFIRDIDKQKTLPIDFAGKIMGLQAYGAPVNPALFRAWFFESLAEYTATGDVMVFRERPCDFFSTWPGGGFGRNSTHARDPAYLDALASMQVAFTGIMVEAALELRRETGLEKLVVSGGCALNVVMNTELARHFSSHDLFISPVSGDTGLALGAAVAGAAAFDKPHDPFACTHAQDRANPYLGLSFVYDGPSKAMPRGCLRMPRPASDPATARELFDNISQGAIVGLVQGRCEIGPRALGNRSIIANPAFTDMRDTLNKKIKYREWWRPFAPVCRLLDAEKFFDAPRWCPYMLFSATVKPEWRNRLPSITHVDGTARLQVLENRAANPLLWDLLTLFAEETGCGVLLNTSFNLGGSPLVNRWSEVMTMLEKTQMDAAWINGELVMKAFSYQLHISGA